MAEMLTTPGNPASIPAESTESVADRVERRVANGELTLSEMGRRLLAARRKIEQSGIPLLNEQELARERAERRGCA